MAKQTVKPEEAISVRQCRHLFTKPAHNITCKSGKTYSYISKGSSITTDEGEFPEIDGMKVVPIEPQN